MKKNVLGMLWRVLKMGKPAKDLRGIKINMLTAICPVGNDKRGSIIWKIQCDCGNERFVPTSSFTKGDCYSCGCMKKQRISEKNTKHNMSHHPMYAVWDTMIARCHRPSHKSYKHYSGRGITVCQKWRNSFQSFADDMLSTYHRGLQLDRKDNDKGYSPENCRWVDCKTQANNTVSNLKINTPIGIMNICEAADYFGIKRTTLNNRVRCGWPEDKWFIPVDYANKVMI